MLIGINYPWLDYGWDFGDAPTAWVAEDNLHAWRESKRKRIKADFERFALQGISALRWFLLGDGLNFGIGPDAPRKIGHSWTFDLLPCGHRFYDRLCDDFEFVLEVCHRSSLKLFPSLLDFSWCQPGKPAAGNPGIVKGGRHECLVDPAKRAAFFHNILDPLLSVSMRHRDSIYAWELINEPEWVVRGFWSRDANRTVPRREMKQFIAEGVRRINAKQMPDGTAAFRSSVGFAHWDTLDAWNAERLGITLPQFHYYAQQNRELPECGAAGRVCIVGEFAAAAGADWPDLKARNSDQSITSRLRCIEDKGYPACFLWSAKATDPATRWTEAARQELCAYIGMERRDTLKA